MEGGGRQGAPQIFADLHTQHKAGHLAAAEQQGGAKGHLLTAHLRQLHLGAARGELALFVELAVVGQIGLGHKAQDPAMAQHGGAVVQLAVHQQRQADQSHHIQLLRFSQQGAQSVQRTGLQSTLQKQVAAGIAGQAELGEHGQLHAAGCGLTQSLGDLPDVIGAVGHPQCGRKGGCFQKTIFHRRFSHPVFLSWLQFPAVHIVYHKQTQTRSKRTMTKTKQHRPLPMEKAGRTKNKKSHTKVCGKQKLRNGKRDRP